MKFKSICAILFSTFLSVSAAADVVQVGSGGYSTTFPGVDSANRNGYPTGDPRVTGEAATKPIPTNDWWSNQLYTDHASNLFNYPLTMRTTDNGIVIFNGIIGQAAAADSPMEVTVDGVSSTVTKVSDHSDWTVTFRWGDDNNYMEALSGVGMPIVYFSKNSTGDVKINTSAWQNYTFRDNVVIVKGSYNNANYAIYAPEGATWTSSNGTLTSSLNGKSYWAVALLPHNASNVEEVALAWEQYAFAFPSETKSEYTYNESTGKVTTTFSVTPDVKEGNGMVLLGLLPHQWAHLASGSPAFTGDTYTSVRGELRMMATNSFSTELTFHGILPTLPAAQSTATGFSQAELNTLINSVNSSHGLTDWTDSYNDGQLINRLIQTARIAKESGYEEGFQTAFNLVKSRTEKWLTYSEGDIAFMFYYHEPWTSLLGYPAGHGQDTNINDHHFHWGYFIHAAAFLEQYEPGWADKFGDMINLLVRDAASTDRNDSMFPYLRSFSPYAGHCWANGTASLGLGNDQESTSESMQFHSSLIHWGTITGNKAIRDLGIYMYVTEQTAVEEYWFDANNRNLPDGYPHAVVSRVFTNAYDSENFWGGGIAGSYGIELYPIHGGSFYLMNNPEFASEFWTAITTDTGILANESNANLWYDTMYQFLAMMDADKAIELYNAGGSALCGQKFGSSKAQTYQWIHALAQLGQFDATITADYPIATAFENNGTMAYVAHNYGAEEIVVTFSDGYQLTVPAGTLATSTGASTLPSVAITEVSATEVLVGTEITINAEASISDATITSVDFYVGSVLIASDTEAPYQCTWTPSAAGNYSVTAIATTSEGKSRTSKAVAITINEEDSDDDGGSDDSGSSSSSSCSYTASTNMEGQGQPFTDGYTLSFKTENDNVIVTCSLLDTQYDLIAYVWDYSNGFAEKAMTLVDGQTFSATLTGYETGATIKVAVKFAFRGGMAVTTIYEYIVGNDCSGSSTSIDDLLDDTMARLFPNPATSIVNIQLPVAGHLYAWNATGNLVIETDVEANDTINIDNWASGIYFFRIETAEGTLVTRLIKE